MHAARTTFCVAPASLTCVNMQLGRENRDKDATLGRARWVVATWNKLKHSCDTVVRNNVQAFASLEEVSSTTSLRAGKPELRNSLAALTTITKRVDSVVSRNLAAHMLNLHLSDLRDRKL